MVLKEENERYQELESGLLELVKIKTKHAFSIYKKIVLDNTK